MHQGVLGFPKKRKKERKKERKFLILKKAR